LIKFLGTNYKGIEGYKQLMVNHSAGEYVNGIVHTNGIESVYIDMGLSALL
jgi:hypothetical protein